MLFIETHNLSIYGASQNSMMGVTGGLILVDFPSLIWLVVWNHFSIFIGNVIIPTDELHHLSEGYRSTTNQLYIVISSSNIHGDADPCGPPYVSFVFSVKPTMRSVEDVSGFRSTMVETWNLG